MTNVVQFPGLLISKIVDHFYKCRVEQIEIHKVDDGIRFVCFATGKRAAGTLRNGGSISQLVSGIVDLLRRVGADVEYKDAEKR